MKYIFTIILGVFSLQSLWAQLDNVDLLFHWKDTTIIGSFAYDNAYNEIWGVVQDGREYAIIGSTAGTHFFDVTDPVNATEVAFVAGAYQGGGVIHRDYHDYAGYLYAVCDEGGMESTLQIIDMQYLPDSVSVVYDSNELFWTSHNIFIDTATANLYICSPGSTGDYMPLQIMSLENPVNPTVVLNVSTDIPRAHDLYVRNDTAYMNCEGSGIYIVDFTDLADVNVLGTITDYVSFGQGYNHSGWLSDDGLTYYFADETWSTDVKVVDVSNLDDISIITTLEPPTDNIHSIAHNQLFYKNYLFVSYYFDGLQVYDVSDPDNPVRVREYDTSEIEHIQNYKGAWGVYPFLPSGNILISDMQEGLFVVDVNLDLAVIDGCTDETAVNYNPDATNDDGSCDFSATSLDDVLATNLTLSPNPTNDFVVLHNTSTTNTETFIDIFDVTGKKILSETMAIAQSKITLNTADFSTGIYFVEVTQGKATWKSKLIKN